MNYHQDPLTKQLRSYWPSEFDSKEIDGIHQYKLDSNFSIITSIYDTVQKIQEGHFSNCVALQLSDVVYSYQNPLFFCKHSRFESSCLSYQLFLYLREKGVSRDSSVCVARNEFKKMPPKTQHLNIFSMRDEQGLFSYRTLILFRSKKRILEEG